MVVSEGKLCAFYNEHGVVLLGKWYFVNGKWWFSLGKLYLLIGIRMDGKNL
jgi:hypothetical protein